MIRILQTHNCCGCQACAQICPKHCISMCPDEEGFLYPVVDEAACISCGLCEKVCPVPQSTAPSAPAPKAYAAWNRNENIRLESSSGGIFSLLAEYILKNGGILYGAAMTGTTVNHIRVTGPEGLALLRGSKYVQSNIGEAYLQAKNDLLSGKTVLFTGTPCQIEGLKTFLQKDYPNLLTLDIICHGVPSPMVWEKYVAFREKAAGAAAGRILFREKRQGWKAYSLFMEFADQTVYARYHREDPFMQAFLKDLCLRPSCYQCSFKKENRVSDLTLGDFWGIGNVCPEMDDDKGTSLVIVHSRKGLELFQAVSGKMCSREVDFQAAIRGNPAMVRSAGLPAQRDAFMRQIPEGDFEALVKRYTAEKPTVKGITKKILAKAGSILHKG